MYGVEDRVCSQHPQKCINILVLNVFSKLRDFNSTLRSIFPFIYFVSNTVNNTGSRFEHSYKLTWIWLSLWAYPFLYCRRPPDVPLFDVDGNLAETFAWLYLVPISLGWSKPGLWNTENKTEFNTKISQIVLLLWIMNTEGYQQTNANFQTQFTLKNTMHVDIMCSQNPKQLTCFKIMVYLYKYIN